MLDKKKVLALVLDHGSRTSHAAILSRALEVPAVLSLHDATIRIPPDETLIVDGTRGVVIVGPTPQDLETYSAVCAARKKIQEELDHLGDVPAEMMDGYQVTLSANMELPDELPHIRATGASGVGLFRTEFLFLSESRLPDEETQFQVYNRIAAALHPDPPSLQRPAP